MKCKKCGSKMKKIDLRFVNSGPFKFCYECPVCEKEEKKYIDPMIIPKFECASFNSRGKICKGTDKLDKDKWCKKCLCFDEGG